MWPFKRENKIDSNIETKNITAMETRNLDGLVVNNPMLSGASSFVNYLQNNNEWKLSFDKMIEYYDRCDPVADSIDMIAESCAEIQPVLKNKKTDELIYDHEILDLLNNPSSNKDWADFCTEAMAMYLITASPLLRISGDFRRTPSKIDIMRPNDTRIEPDLFGNIRDIYVNNEFFNTVFTANNIGNTTRYRNKMDNEIWPMFGFNSGMGTRNFYGTPKLQQLFYKIEQTLAGGLHNKSLLENGASPSGSFSTESSARPLSDDQHRRMQQQIIDNYMGPSNANKPMLLEWVKWQSFLVNNRDMDYSALMADCRTGIYNRFKIPLPMVEPSSQKFSNFDKAREAMYITAVLPNLFYFYRQLKLALMYRYEKNWQDFDIVCDLSEIHALQGLKFDMLDKQSNAAVNTVNELRRVIGYDDISGGDVILRAANQVPALDYDGYDDDGSNDKNQENNNMNNSTDDNDEVMD